MYVLALFAVAATAVVAGHRHTPVDVATPTAGDAPQDPHGTPAQPAALARAGVLSRDAKRPMRLVRSRSIARKPPRPHVPLAHSDAVQTARAALTSDYNVPGHCLEWSREQAGIPPKYADAATAWQHATGRRPADPDPPRGAAVYWTGGSSGYGHIAISVGHGKVRSSDAGGTGEVATVPIHHLSAEWDLHYAGWANSINGYKIPGVRPA